ncbi:hypothetical protein EON64_13735 [archaeon]|nr:MAG: hypothetical protein EON64_13735 [archaeon]
MLTLSLSLRYLLAVQQKAAAQFRDIAEAQLSVSLAVSDVLKTKTQVRALSYLHPCFSSMRDIIIYIWAFVCVALVLCRPSAGPGHGHPRAG